jgi:hypothetical protein
LLYGRNRELLDSSVKGDEPLQIRRSLRPSFRRVSLCQLAYFICCLVSQSYPETERCHCLRQPNWPIDQPEDAWYRQRSNGTQTLHLLHVVDDLTFAPCRVYKQDPLVQYPGYSIYAKTNPYRQTASDLTIAKANASFHQVGGCQDLVCVFHVQQIYILFIPG